MEEKNTKKNYILGSHIIDMQKIIFEEKISEYTPLNNFNTPNQRIQEYYQGQKDKIKKWEEDDISVAVAIKDNFIPIPYQYNKKNNLLAEYKSIEDTAILLNKNSLPYTIRFILKAMIENWKIKEKILNDAKSDINKTMEAEGRKKLKDEEKELLLKKQNAFPFIEDSQSIFLDYRLFVYYLIHLFKSDPRITEYEKISSILNFKKDGLKNCAFINAYLGINDLIDTTRLVIKKIFYTRQDVVRYGRAELENLAKKEDNLQLMEALKKAQNAFYTQNFEIPSCTFIMQGFELKKSVLRGLFYNLGKIEEYEEILDLARRNVFYSQNFNKLKKSQEGRAQDYSKIHYAFQSSLPTSYSISPLIFISESFG